MTVNDGSWTKEGDMVVFTYLNGSRSVYQKIALEKALENVRNNRDWYVAETLWKNAIAHFEHGLALFS